MLRNRGLENIVAAVLLMAIVAVVITLMYHWLSSYTVTSVAQIREQAEPEFFKIVAVNYNSSTYNLTIYLLNTGITPVEIALIEVLNASTGMPIDNCVFTKTIVVEPKREAVISVTCPLREGSVYLIKVYSKKGNYAEYYLTYGVT